MPGPTIRRAARADLDDPASASSPLPFLSLSRRDPGAVRQRLPVRSHPRRSSGCRGSHGGLGLSPAPPRPQRPSEPNQCRTAAPGSGRRAGTRPGTSSAGSASAAVIARGRRRGSRHRSVWAGEPGVELTEAATRRARGRARRADRGRRRGDPWRAKSFMLGIIGKDSRSDLPPSCRSTHLPLYGRTPAAQQARRPCPADWGRKADHGAGRSPVRSDASLVANRRPRPRARCARTPAHPLRRRGDGAGSAAAGRRRAASLAGFPTACGRAARCR